MEYGNEVSAPFLWNLIKDSIDGTSDERKLNEYTTHQIMELWNYYRNTITISYAISLEHKESVKKSEISLP
jgi:hypothetical protein